MLKDELASLSIWQAAIAILHKTYLLQLVLAVSVFDIVCSNQQTISYKLEECNQKLLQRFSLKHTDSH